MKKQFTLGMTLSLISSLAFAHPGHGFSDSFVSGFMHPLMGWDHLLVMLSIGVWAAKLGGKACWQIPLTFMFLMTLGASLGIAGLAFTGLETAIAASVVAMGLLLVLSLRLNPLLQISLTAFFALMHGWAHGVELNHSALPFMGMLLATGLLHVVGLLIGMQRIRISGFVSKVLGLGMLLVGAYWAVAS